MCFKTHILHVLMHHLLCYADRSGEECDNTQRCLTHLVCHSNTRTCGCAPGKKELTVRSKSEKGGVDVFSHRCIDDAGTIS